MTLKWNGEQIKRAVRRASYESVQNTLEDAVKRAKKKHPGWRTRTGQLEGSIQVFEVKEIATGIEGGWGAGAFYAVFFERGTAKMPAKPFLRPAARAAYRRLKFRVRHRFKSLIAGVRA